MSTVFTKAFDSAYDSMPSARAQARYALSTIDEALSAGLVRQYSETDEGLYEQFTGSIRVKAADIPSEWPDGDAINGKVIEIVFAEETEWVRARVVAIEPKAGIIRMDVAAEFGTL